ncbi:MAG: hypothetical protein WAU86_20170 [Oricola sp.]
MTKLFYWAPRLLGIMAILFISMFALDVFEPGKPWREIAVALSMHLLPSFVLMAILVLAWRVEWLGGMLFVLVGLSPFVLLGNPAQVNLMIGGPFIVTGLLFLASSRMRNRHRRKSR